MCRNFSWLIRGLGWPGFGVATAICSLTFVAMLLVILDIDSVAQRLAEIFFGMRTGVGFSVEILCVTISTPMCNSL
jgi:hypothetical protein